MVTLTKEQIDNYFNDAKDQGNVFINLYRHVYPNWDNIKMVEGWPTISEQTNDYIFKKFIQFDKENHPNVVPGGLWLNSGFSSLQAEDIPDWKIKPAEYTLKDK